MNRYEYRQTRTGKIHVFEPGPDGQLVRLQRINPAPGDQGYVKSVCGEQWAGSLSLPLEFHNLEKGSICARCAEIVKAREAL